MHVCRHSRHRNSAACYQLAQSVLKIGSALAERVGQGEVGGCTALADSAWGLLQLAWYHSIAHTCKIQIGYGKFSSQVN